MKLRRDDVYILNILRCRPPDNRPPLPPEPANCREYLYAQLAIIQPQFVCCFGASAAKNLLNVDTPIGELRGRMIDFNGMRVLCTYHPAYVLRNPQVKRQVWDDIQVLMEAMGLKGPVPMTDIEKARQLFQKTGLAFPTIPEEFAPRLSEHGKWLFSTREIEASPYDLDHYVDEVARVPVEDYVVLSHAGHGVNSYAIQYYLVQGALRMFLHLGWGGVYMDAKVAAAKIQDCFSLADKIVSAAQSEGRFQPGDQLTVIGSDFYGSYWLPPGESRLKKGDDSKTPANVLTEVLHWLTSPQKTTAIADNAEAICPNPKDSIAYYNRGVTYVRKGDLNKAISDYTEAIRLDPNFAQAYFNRGNAYSHKGDLDKTIADYTEAIRLNPKYADAYCGRGLAYAQKGEYDKEITDCTEAIRLNPKHAIAYNNRGAAYGKQGECDEEIADCTEAIHLNPKLAPAYFNRGLAYVNKGDVEKAIADYTEAIRLNPKDVRAHFNLGMANAQKGEYDKAIADYTEVIRLNSKYVDVYRYRGIAYDSNGDLDKAIADYTEAIRLNPKDAIVYNNRGVAYGRKGDHNKAIADCTEATRLDPKFAQAYFNLALAQGNKG